MSPAEDFVLWSNLPEERIEVRDSDLVFAGYGVVAPKYNWNDYAGIDVKGKTVMVITGDPPLADLDNSTKLDEHVFLGNALTVYGRNGTSWRPHSSTEQPHSSWFPPPSRFVTFGKIAHART
jgi:hypothetical protein